MEFNVNNSVRVKLTEHGRAVHKKTHEELFAAWVKPPPYIKPTEDHDGWSEWQLWCLMEAFGQHTHLGSKPCFETTIEIVTPNAQAKRAAEGAAKSAANRNARFALGRLKVGQMNKTEKAYEQRLIGLEAVGAVLWWRFEGIKLRLADNTFYTPDFAVMAKDGVLELHEVKGFWQDDARVKIKVAAEMYPFRFKAFKVEAQKRGGGWTCEEFE